MFRVGEERHLFETEEKKLDCERSKMKLNWISFTC